MKKDSINKKRRTYFVLLLLLFLNISWMPSVQGQESPAAGIPSSDQVQLKVIESGHPWQPPFSVNRVGRSYDVVVNIKSKKLPEGEFLLVSYLLMKEVNRQTVYLTNKIPLTGRMPGRAPYVFTEDNKQITVSFIDNQAFSEKTGDAYTGKATIIGNTDQVALFFNGIGKDPVELARQAIKLPSFEAEAAARPDKVINPVDLNTILVPADWLLLAGGQKAYVKVAVLNRDNTIADGRIMSWYDSAPENKVNESLKITQGNKVQKELSLPACSRILENDILHVSIEDAKGKEIWHKEIKVMIVPNPPALPSFGAVKTKLRYDIPVLNIVKGKNVPLDYDKLWEPEFKDLVVCLPNGSRWVFWRGTSYIPVWAGQYNTGLSYEWAERGFPRGDFVDCIEPLMDKELRFSRVEIVESTNARIHVRWNYQSCDFNYKVNGDLAVEDYYFYPDGLGTRVLELATVPEGDYELSELIILTPKAAFPLEYIPSDPVDIISVKTGEKAVIRLPQWFSLIQGDQAWQKVNDPAVYRIRLHKDEPLSAICFNPFFYAKPRCFFAWYDKGFLATPAYWGAHWPLSRGLMTNWTGVGESIWSGPSHNSLMSWSMNRPKPIKSAIVIMNDALGILKPMKLETWAWLIGMTDANDDLLLQIAKSYAQPPSLELIGAKQNPEPYSYESRALHLTVEKKRVTIKIKPDVPCLNPVFELQNAPKTLRKVKLGWKTLASDKYAWDGHTLWLNITINQPEKLKLIFKRLRK
jgi:hypothetical protein